MDNHVVWELEGTLRVVRIEVEDPGQAEILPLLAASDALMAELYPAESNHMIDVAALRSSDVAFVVARVDDRACGCGAVVKLGKDCVELKRLFVSPTARGQKLGQRILSRLESIAIESGAKCLQLETGIKQPEALSLYRKAGYIERGPFGEYRLDPMSIFMEKTVTAT